MFEGFGPADEADVSTAALHRKLQASGFTIHTPSHMQAGGAHIDMHCDKSQAPHMSPLCVLVIVHAFTWFNDHHRLAHTHTLNCCCSTVTPTSLSLAGPGSLAVVC